jgi:hypothetical protein
MKYLLNNKKKKNNTKFIITSYNEYIDFVKTYYNVSDYVTRVRVFNFEDFESRGYY